MVRRLYFHYDMPFAVLVLVNHWDHFEMNNALPNVDIAEKLQATLDPTFILPP